MRYAIIDIGYNAIRSVVYENETLGSPEIFNSKFKHDILSLLSSESFDIKHQTYLSLQYFLHIFKKLKVTKIRCVATAILRKHERSQKFVEYIKEKYNFEVEILSGKDEANLSALGLTSSIKNCDGLAIDLGGGSLELIEVKDKKIIRSESFDLGTKVINSKNIKTSSELISVISQLYEHKSYNSLYFIGGALRFMGRLYIDFMQYPMKNLHGLEIEIDQFLRFMSKLDVYFNSSKTDNDRHKFNKDAVFIIKGLIEMFSPKKVVISTYGLKEGVRIESMNKSERNKDIVIEKAKHTCNFSEKDTHIESYINMINPFINGKKDLHRIIRISIILYSLKNNFDKTMPPYAVSEYILSSEIPFSYRERVMVALILSYSTNHKPTTALMILSKRMINKFDHNSSKIIGNILRIAEEIDGNKFTSPSFSIKDNSNYLEIETENILPRSIFEKVCYLLKTVAYSRKVNSVESVDI